MDKKSMSTSNDGTDHWYTWVMEGQYGGDNEYAEKLRGAQIRVVSRVLDNSRVGAGMTLLDVGSGDGLVGFTAADRVGPKGKVVFSDISPGLVEVCRRKAEERSLSCATECIHAGVEDLGAIGDGTIDVVTSRSVLMYSENKEQAFREIFRVLKNGGIYSGFEPINQFSFKDRGELSYMGFDFSGIADLARRVLQRITPLPHDVALREDPIVNYDERDLMQILNDVRFGFIRLEYEAMIISQSGPQRNWDVIYRIPPNPTTPSLEEAVKETLEEEEQQAFVEYARNLVRTHTPPSRRAFSYLVGVKPMES